MKKTFYLSGGEELKDVGYTRCVINLGGPPPVDCVCKDGKFGPNGEWGTIRPRKPASPPACNPTPPPG